MKSRSFSLLGTRNCGAKIFLLIYGHICLCNMHICAWENWDLIYYTFAQQATLCDRGRSKWEILNWKEFWKWIETDIRIHVSSIVMSMLSIWFFSRLCHSWVKFMLLKHYFKSWQMSFLVMGLDNVFNKRKWKFG